ncbi:hypothetical protein NL50_01005 [Clostridium acetobutylicum]|nr:hypothetical protein NL50_01005 [Clostridium acetobutylicum]
MKKNILFVEINPGMESSGAHALRLCSEKGIGCYVLTSDKKFYDTPNGNPLDTADRVFEYPTDKNHLEQSSAYVSELMESFHFVAVVSFSELYIETASYIAKQLNLPYNNYEQISIARDKYKWRKFLSQKGFKMPKFMLIKKMDDIKMVASEIGFPCVFKPVDGSASVGVQYCTSNDDLKCALKYWNSFGGFGRGITLKNEAMVEEYIDGPLYSAECINFNNKNYCLGFTDRKLSGAPYFAETRANFPCEIKDSGKIIDEIYGVIDAIGFKQCALHIEFIVSQSGEICIVDINARLGGGLISQMIYETTGIDPVSVVLDMLIGKTPNIERTKNRYAASRYVGTYGNGTVHDVLGISQIIDDPNIKQFELYINKGQIVKKMISNKDTIFEFFAVGDSYNDANGNADNAINNMHLLIDAELCY